MAHCHDIVGKTNLPDFEIKPTNQAKHLQLASFKATHRLGNRFFDFNIKPIKTSKAFDSLVGVLPGTLIQINTFLIDLSGVPEVCHQSQGIELCECCTDVQTCALIYQSHHVSCFNRIGKADGSSQQARKIEPYPGISLSFSKGPSCCWEHSNAGIYSSSQAGRIAYR